ncbi:MAG: Decarboxylase [Actinomycetota bacterium]|nr:Decarboxylase [Actinomycetota bacterium]
MPRSPLADAWRQAMALRRRPLQIPGHKNRYATDEPALGDDLLRAMVRDDIPLQGGVDDNAFSHHYLEQAEELWAAAVGADHCRFLVGGSSQGNIAALSTVTHPGQPVAVDRTSHRSTHAALVITGARPVWVYPDLDPEFRLPIGIPAGDLERLTEPVTALFVTSPSYVGSLCDVPSLAAAAHVRGIPLVVDQAWGAHLGFLPGRGAIALGADVSVTSVHKALMGYSQTAVISMRHGLVDPRHLNRCVDLVATTSPSGTLMSSIDATRAVMERDGAAALDRTIELVLTMRRRLAAVPGLVILDDENVPNGVDPFKVTLWLPRTGVSGIDLNARLWDLGHGPETADRDTLVLTITLLDEPEFVSHVTDVIIGLIEELRGDPRPGISAAVWALEPEVVVTPREAFFASRRRIDLADAVGEVSAEQFCPYPPGVPLIAPGERVTQAAVDALAVAARVGRVAYNSDPTMRTIEIVDEL